MLKLSTKARYAMRAMLELALREGAGPVQLREVARAQHISPKYLEQLAIPLHHAGLVHTERGPSGGYRLAKPASAITALDVVQAVEGPLLLLDCLANTGACDRSGACAARGLWGRVTEAMAAVLAETTLTDLRDSQLEVASKQALSYHI